MPADSILTKAQIIVYCYGCFSINKKQQEGVQEEYESFSEAHDHALENPTHFMVFQLKEISND